jgi:NADPH-dependent curcumin reductase CurA
MPNQTLIFKKVPAGVVPVPGEHLVVENRPFDLGSAPPPGGVVLQTNYASFDPFLRVKMCSADNASLEPFEINGPIDNSTISTVIKSDTPDYRPGDIVAAYVPIAEYNVLTSDKLNLIEGKVDNRYGLDLGLFLGPLGMPGLTAYSSLYEIGEPKKGQTLFVTSAAGAVGQLVGQLAKREGLTVIGSVGSDDKLAFITSELGFDGGFNYKTEKTSEALQRLAPEGIDIFYDNVGGEQFEATLLHMKTLGRVVISGAVS